MHFLRRMGHSADEVDYAVVKVDAETLEEALTLSRRLLVWNAVNGADARLVA